MSADDFLRDLTAHQGGGGAGSIEQQAEVDLGQEALLEPLPRAAVPAGSGASDGPGAPAAQREALRLQCGAAQLPPWAARQPSVLWLRVLACAPPPLSLLPPAGRHQGSNCYHRWSL